MRDLERRLRASALRDRMSVPELLLWTGIKGRRLNGLHFRRQHPFGPYVLDFYCASFRLCIEVDGAQHGLREQRDHDARRDAWLAEQGVTTIRIPARDILDDVQAVIAGLQHELSSRISSPA